MKTIQKLFAVAALGAALNANAASIFFFGDSLSDTGNTQLLLQGLGVPNSSIPTTQLPYANGQYTDAFGGGVWSQQFAARLGTTAAPSLAGGTNFAFAGARSYTNTGGVPGLGDQVGFYLTSPLSGARSNAADLFVIMIGGNDIQAALESGNAAAGLATGLGNIRSAVGGLYADGARRFLIANMPRADLTPRVQSFGAGVVAGFKGFEDAWNANFNALIGGLSVGLVGSDIDVLDLASLGSLTTAQFATFGITNTTDACFNVAAGSQARVCRESQYSDSFHPTSRAHTIIADLALNAIPLPGTAALLGLGFLGFAALRRKAA